MFARPSSLTSHNSCCPRLFSVLSVLSELRKISSRPGIHPLIPASPAGSLPVQPHIVQDCANPEQITPSFSIYYKLPIPQLLSFDTLTNALGGAFPFHPLRRLLHTQQSPQPISFHMLIAQLADTPGGGPARQSRLTKDHAISARLAALRASALSFPHTSHESPVRCSSNYFYRGAYKEGRSIIGGRTDQPTTGGGRRAQRQFPCAAVRRRNTCDRARSTLRCLRGSLFSAR